MLTSGKQSIIYNRVGWARTYLQKAGLLSLPQRGFMDITERGRQVLSEKPEAITIRYLDRFPEFVEFRSMSGEDESIPQDVSPLAQKTPNEALLEAHTRLKAQVLLDIVDRIKACPPQFFERLVVDLVVKMGYGGSYEDAGRAIGATGDEGIDGIINEDRLGLDVIYLQAKRLSANVGRPEVQKFAGALQGKRAKKGILITTSDFSSDAREFVKTIESKIILISGQQLAELMWEYGVGFSREASYEVNTIDTDYFDQ